MDGDAKSLEILIKILAELQGAKDAEAALKKLNAEAANQVKASSELSDAGKRYADQLKNTVPEAEKFNLSQREAREMLHGITRESPEAGHALSALANPWVGLALAVSAALEQYFAYTEATREYINSPLPDLEWKDVERKDALRKVVTDLTAAWDEYNRQRAEAEGLGSVQQRAAEGVAAATAADKERLKAETDTLGAAQAMQIAAIDEREKHNLLSHAQAEAEKFRIDQEYAQKRLQLEAQARQDEIKRLQYEADYENNMRIMGKAGLPRANQSATDAATAAEDNRQRVAALQANIEKEKADANTAADEEVGAQEDINSLGPLTDPTGKRRAAAQAARDAGASRRAADTMNIGFMQSELNSRKGAQGALDAQATETKDKLEELKKQVDEATTKFHELTDQLGRLRTADQTATGAGAAVAGDKATEAAIKVVGGMMNNPAAMNDAAAAAQALLNGGSATPGQQAEIAAISTLLQAVGENQKDIIAALAASAHNHQAARSEIADIRRALEQLSGTGQTHSTTSGPG